MKKIIYLLLLSLMALELPAMSACPIDNIKNCNPSQKQQLNPTPQPIKNIKKIKTVPKANINNTEADIYYSASCEFGVCQPKPPKR